MVVMNFIIYILLRTHLFGLMLSHLVFGVIYNTFLKENNFIIKIKKSNQNNPNIHIYLILSMIHLTLFE